MAKRVRRPMRKHVQASLRAVKGEVTKTNTRSVAQQALQDLGAHWHPDAKQYYLPVYSVDDQGRRITRFLPAKEWRTHMLPVIGPRSVWASTAEQLNKARLALRHAYRFRGPMARVNPWPMVKRMIDELDSACGVPVPGKRKR